jgi:MoaA/NifB/PqqE/SkfB family radical SAM enzyme
VIDPSNGCNLACPGCVHSVGLKERQLFLWEKGLLSPGRLEAFLRAYGPYAIHLNFYNYGEPLLNAATPAYIRKAKCYFLHTTVSTNLTVPHFDAEAYAESRLDFLIASIDGATQATYEKFRRNGKLAVALRNLASLVEAKHKLGLQTPVIAWRYITFRHNAHEIETARRMARDLGVDQFLTLPPYDVSWDDSGLAPAEVEPVNELFNPWAEHAVLGNWNTAPDGPDFESIERAFDEPLRAAGDGGGSGESCRWLYRNMTMDANGRILPCCMAPRPDADLVFSYFDEGGAEDVFNSPKYRQARRAAANPAEVPAPFCARCGDRETVITDASQIRQYFKALTGGALDVANAAVLAEW